MPPGRADGADTGGEDMEEEITTNL
jgi:hypothetical protein